MNIICPICKRDTPEQHQEEHHLIPKGLSRRNKYAKKDDVKETVTLCTSCGDQLHKLFTTKELADMYNTIVAIVSNEDVQKWIGWISKKPNDFSVCMKEKKKR